MTFGLFKSIFKEVCTLSTKEPYLANAVKLNLRIHYNHYQTQLSIPRKREFKQKNDELLKAFLEFLKESNQQSSQFSQKARMKLVELVCNINKFVNNRFQIRKDILSHQMQILQKSKQYRQLTDQAEKDFVRNVIKKVYRGEETYDYSNLTDFFKDHRFETCQRGEHNFKQMNAQTKLHVQGILKGEKMICPYYKRVYEYYFTDVQKKQLAFESYLNCGYILIDFDDVEEEWQTNTRQVEKVKQIQANKHKIQAVNSKLIHKKVFEERKKVKEELKQVYGSRQKKKQSIQKQVKSEKKSFFKTKK